MLHQLKRGSIWQLVIKLFTFRQPGENFICNALQKNFAAVSIGAIYLLVTAGNHDTPRCEAHKCGMVYKLIQMNRYMPNH